MLFNSSAFLLFLPVVLLVWHLGPERLRKPALLAASYVFYAWWDWRFLSLLLLSTAVDYACARGMQGAPAARRKRLLWVSLATNLGMLGLFKYFDFFVANLRAALQAAGLGALDSVALELVLPLGISFYTFQTPQPTRSTSTAADLQPRRGLLDYVDLRLLLPAAGRRADRARGATPPADALARRRRDAAMRQAGGFALLLLGVLLKKVVLGDDLLAPYRDPRLRALRRSHSADWTVWTRRAALLPVRSTATSAGYTDMRDRDRDAGCSAFQLPGQLQAALLRDVASSDFWRGGTSRSRRGCATTSTSPSAATARARNRDAGAT